MDVERSRTDEVLAEEMEGYDSEDATEFVEDWMERVPPGEEPVEPEDEGDAEAKADGGACDPTDGF